MSRSSRSHFTRFEAAFKYAGGFFQHGQKSLPILLIAEDGFPPVAPTHDVIDGTSVLQTQLPVA